MKKIKRFILLAVLAAMAAVASTASPKQPIDVAFAQLAQTLIDMGAIICAAGSDPHRHGCHHQ